MKLAIVVPCYNEEAVLPETTARLTGIIDKLKARKSIDNGMILYVDDGSRDATWSIIEQFSKKYSNVAGLKLSHNKGHQHALWAGLEWASDNVDAAISIDADLQDDENVILEMVDYFNAGIDIVYGVRKERGTDTFFKRTTAVTFYKLMNALGGNIIYNHADYRLMSRRALRALMSFPERNLFLRGMVASLGFPSACVYYDRKARFAGTSKYPFSKMFSFAVDGITSFSTRPLRFITYLGLIFILIALGVILYALIEYFNGMTIQGWTSLLVSVWFIGGVVLLACGITGEYVGKIYIETKSRPRYFIEKTTGLDEAGDDLGKKSK
mgnify:CR=1 FL=1